MPKYRMRKLLNVAVCFCLLCAFLEALADTPTVDENSDEKLEAMLRQTIQLKQQQAWFTCRGELICGIADLPLFYARRDFRPAWTTQRSIAPAEALLRALRVADLDGLRIKDYHIDQIETLLNTVKYNRYYAIPSDPETLVDLDLLLTDAFLLLGSHLMAGRVNPERVHTQWTAHTPGGNLVQHLQHAVETGRIESAIDRLRPPHHGYRALKSALNRYREIQTFGGWPILGKQFSWQKGDFGLHIGQLRERLKLSGDLPVSGNPDGGGFLFDEHLETGIRQFQLRHGLPMSGVIDAATLETLNIPVDARIRQIELNLERWRWVPHDLGDQHLLVNIADFTLVVVEADRPQWTMRVVVGRDYRRTPVFSAELKYLVINPYWNIPRRIAVEDILPKARRNPGYLTKKKIRVFESWAEDARELDPVSIDWSNVTERQFAFKFRKDPGPFNDLGRIKFMLPNKYAVYLHDTPRRELFNRNSRSYSSGCIRVERPIDLADYLLRDDPKWNRQRIIDTIEGEAANIIVPLRKPVPVHLLYWTAWVDHDGRVHFRKDIYKRDPLLDVALKGRPPVMRPEIGKRPLAAPDRGLSS